VSEVTVEREMPVRCENADLIDDNDTMSNENRHDRDINDCNVPLRDYGKIA